MPSEPAIKPVKNSFRMLILNYFPVGEKKNFVFEEKSVTLKSKTTQQQDNR